MLLTLIFSVELKEKGIFFVCLVFSATVTIYLEYLTWLRLSFCLKSHFLSVPHSDSGNFGTNDAVFVSFELTLTV